MGQKVNPISLRLNVNRTWDSRWYAGKNYASLLQQDLKIRTFIMKKLKQAAVSKVVIERPAKKACITIYSARPGIIIGKKGTDLDALKKEVSKMLGSDVSINILEIRKPEADAQLVADGIAHSLSVVFFPSRHEGSSVRIAHGSSRHSCELLRSFGWCRNRTCGMVP